MKLFDLIIDEENLEIFPKEIWANSNIVYHGTSEYHSERIETNGFIPATSPFNIDAVKELLEVLKDPRVSEFDKPKIIFGITTLKVLNSYIFGIENKDFRLSFAYLSLLSALFSTGRNKGGQTLGNIRDSEYYIEQAIKNDESVGQLLTNSIKNIFNAAKEVSDAKGVIYAVELNSPYKGISEEYGTIHSKEPITPDRIVGKVILPDDFDIGKYDIKTLKDRNKQKLVKPGHLGILLNREK